MKQYQEDNKTMYASFCEEGHENEFSDEPHELKNGTVFWSYSLYFEEN